MEQKIISTALFLLLLSSITFAQVELAVNNDGVSKSTEKSNTTMKSESRVIPVFSFNNYLSASLSNNSSELNDEELVAQKLQIIQQTFTYTTPIAPGNPGLKTIVRKPSIYNTIMKLEKHYRKQIKSGSMAKAEATKAFSNALDVALSAFYDNSEMFEQELKSTKDIYILAQIFEKAEIK